MFKVCLPLSHLLETKSFLVGSLIEEADVLEFRHPGWPYQLPEKPRVFHWGYGLVQERFIPAFDEDHIGRFLKEIRAEMFSFDLGPACRKNIGILPHSPTLSKREILAAMAKSLEHVRRVYDGALAAENYNYYPTGLYRYITEPDFIAQTLEEFDLGLVLDLAHAAVTAGNQNRGIRDYLLELPLDRVVEVHLSRPFRHDAICVDAHDPPLDDDFELLGFVLERIPASGRVLVALEYYQDLETMVRLHQALDSMLNRLNSSDKMDRCDDA